MPLKRVITVPLWCQKASKREGGLVIWDYHVILIKKLHQSVVYDLDSTLPFPCKFLQYATCTFKSDEFLKNVFHRKFRVIEAELFLQGFASDRSHMLQSGSGEWLKPPPTYPCIQTSDSSNNLPEFLSMDPYVGIGQILTLDQLMEKFMD
ncbi:Protein N-terminal glutamine amidohydrolase, variant 2 [Chamberlinius hualienensis]